jgi:hypothetical protein
MCRASPTRFAASGSGHGAPAAPPKSLTPSWKTGYVQPFHCLLQAGQRLSVGNAQMIRAGDRTEVGPRGERDAGFVQDPPAKRLGILAVGPAVRVDVERALGTRADRQAQPGQGLEQKVPTRAELPHPCLQLGLRGRFERGQSRRLREGRRGHEQVLGQPAYRLDPVLRNHHPAEPPAGHRVVLGKAVDDDRVGNLRQGRARRLIEHQPAVDLIHDQRTAPRPHHLGNRDQFPGAQERPRGVRGRSQHQCPGLRSPGGRNLFRGGLKTLLGWHRKEDGRGTERRHELPIARVAGIRQEDPVARVRRSGQRQQNARGSPGRDHYALGVQRQPVRPGIVGCNPRAQFGRALCRRVADATARERAATGFDNGFRGREVGLTDLKMNHVRAMPLQRMRVGQHLHDPKRLHRVGPRGERRRHIRF